MPQFVFRSPEGKEYAINAPEGTTQEQAWGFLQQRLGSIQPPQPEPEAPGILSQIAGAPKEFVKSFTRGTTTDPLSGATSLLYTGARAAGAELTPFEQTGFGKTLAGAQEYLAPSDTGVITQVAGGLGSIASFAPGFFIKGGLKALTLGAQAMGLGSEEARARAEQAQLEGKEVSAGQQFVSQLGGSGVGLTELFPAEKLFGPLSKLFRGLTPDDAAKYAPGISAAVKRMAVTGGVEGAQEGIANIMQDLIQKGVYDPNLEIGQSALGDAALGASVGAIAQGTIDFITRGKRAEAYRQLKAKEDEEKNAALRADELKKIQETSQRLGVDPNVLALPAPTPQITEEEKKDPLLNPVGFFAKDDLDPKVFKELNKIRNAEGKVKLDKFSIEDLADSGMFQAEIDRLLTARMGFGTRALSASEVEQTLTPENILSKAQERNIETGTPGFNDFLRRVSGSDKLENMSQAQLYSAFTSLDALADSPDLRILPQGTNATRFTQKQYDQGVAYVLDQIPTKEGVLSQKDIIQAIKDSTLLESDRDAESLLQTAIRKGDLDTSSKPRYFVTDANGKVVYGYANRKDAQESASKNNLFLKEGTVVQITSPREMKQLPGGPDIRKGTFKEGVEPVGFELISDDGKFKRFYETKEQAEAESLRLNELRNQKALKKLEEAAKEQRQIEKSKRKLEDMEIEGKADTLDYKKESARIFVNNKRLEEKINRLKKEAEGFSQPLTIQQKGEKPVTRQGFTLFQDGKPVATFPTVEDAQLDFISRADQDILQRIADVGPTLRTAMPKRLANLAKRELSRRAGRTEELGPQGIQVKFEGTREEAEARLAESGIQVKFSPDVQTKVDELQKKLLPALQKLGLKDVGLRIINAIKADQATGDGEYSARLITIALDATDPMGVLRHESVHALKELGAFTKNEWRVLENKAKSEWIDKYLKSRKASTGRSLYDEYMSVYDGRPDRDDIIIEEAIAEAFRDFSGKRPAGMIGNVFYRIGRLFESLKNAFTGAGFDTADSVFERIEEGQMTRREPTEIEGQRYAMRVEEPVSPMAQYVTPAEAEGRLRRRMGRAEGVGAPTNDRMVFGTGKDRMVVGQITPLDWKQRVENTLTPEEIVDARTWYQQLHDFFDPVFGEKAADYALAWLLSQKRASPTKGMTDVLRASDIAQGKYRYKKAGLNEKALIAAIRKEVPDEGIGAKLLDFIDSELGKSTRTVMGGAKEGRQPAAIDVWAQRDIGFIDDTTMEFVAKKYGKDAAEKISVDRAFGEPQYEYGVDFYNNVADALNRQKYMGGGWTAREVQAVGWVGMQKFMGVKPEFVRDIIGGNTRRVSIGLAPGKGSVMESRIIGKELPVKDAQHLINELGKIANIKVTQSVDGVGAYLTDIEGSIQVDALGSPEAVDDFMDMIGYVFQQTEVINTRPLASGKNSAVDILSPRLNTKASAIQFFTEFLNKMPKTKDGDPIAPGFQQVKVNGVPGIRIVNFDGKWNKKQIEGLSSAAKEAGETTGLEIEDFVDMNVVLTRTGNDWVKYPDGEQYVDSLRNRGRLQEAQLLQREFIPTRFDIAGDGSINWRPKLPRYSLRSDELIGGSSLGSGISIREQQPTAQSYDAVHYGKQRVETLAGSMYGTGIKGAEAQRVFGSSDPRIKQRAYFYIPQTNGRMPMPEAGLGSEVHVQRLNNLLGPSPEMQALVDATRGPDGRMDANAFESAVVDAGYDGYAVPDMGMAVVLGANVPVQPRGTRQEVEARAPKDSIQIGDRRYSLRQTDTPEFKRWFGKSKISTLRGEPIRMYHGTARDITEFKPKQANAIFLTDDPRFAESFGDMSEDFMVRELFDSMTQEEQNKLKEQSIQIASKEGTSAEDAVRELIKERLPSRSNIMPLYVRAEKPFDFDNKEHVGVVIDEVKRSSGDYYNDWDLTLMQEVIQNGSWKQIEDTEVQNAIRKLGFDSFYVNEGGKKNLAVYDPNQIKSAVGNIGTFSRTDKDIRYALALGNIEPSTAVVPDDGGSPDGNMGILPTQLGGKPIRLLVGTHDDIENKGYGANHILNRVLSDPRRVPEGAEELLEKIARTAQRTAQTYKQIFKDGNKYVLYDGKNSLVLSVIPDQASIVTMFTQTNPEAKYGRPVWSGRAPAMAEFLEPVRGVSVEAREGRVAPKRQPVAIKAKRVITPAEVSDMIVPPKVGGTLGVRRLSLRAQPMDTDEAQVQDASGVEPNSSRDNLIYLLQDKQIDLKRVIEGIRKAGKDVADRWNAYLKEELFHGRSATRIRFFADRELQPLLRKMEAANVSLDQMDTYLLARHAKEANAYIRSINPDPTANAGMTDQEADNYMKSLSAPRRAALERIAKDVDAMTKETRNLLVEYGLEKPETIATWEKTYKNYVPLFRQEIEGDPDTQEYVPISIGRGYNIRGSTVGRRMGSSKKVIDVLANIAMQRERIIVRGEKNRVGNALYGLVLQNPNKGFWGVINPEKTNKSVLKKELLDLGIDPSTVDNMVARPIEQTIDKKTGLVTYRVPPLWKNNKNIFITRINGEDRVIGFNKNDERAMRMVATLKNLDAQQQGEAINMMGTAGDYYRKVIEGVGKVTRFFASVNTQYNPAFGIYNLMRDIGGATLNLQSTPLKGKERKVLGDAFVALKDVYRDLRRARNGLEADSKWAEIFEEFELEGGKTGYRDMFENAKDRADQLQKEIQNFGKGTIKGKGTAIMNWLSDFNDAIENAVRVSVYKNALDQGFSKERAASLAKNITVNFNRTGAISRNFQTLYAFFNASVQGTARIAQTLLTKDGKLSPLGKKIVMGGITLGMAQAVLLAMAGLDDDEVPDFVKDKNFVIPTGDGKYLAIPMPLGYNIIPGFGRRVMEFAMSDNKNIGKSVFETSQMILDGFNPLGSATFVQTLSPTLLDPIVALAENKDFTGKPIAREDINSLKPTPGYTRGSQNASAITEGLAYAINILSGGTEFKKGVISPTPDQIEYLVGQVFGGVGREAMKIGRGIESVATGEELATYNIPIAGRMIGNVQQKAAQTSRFYENVRRLNEHQAEIEGRMIKGQDISDYIDQFPEASMYQVGDKIYSQISKLRQTKKALQEAGAGRDDVKAIDEAMLGLMTSLNQIYDSARQR